ncbi:hypothetical protein Tco_0133778, partial [Tanacetum coccineum]
MNANEDKYLDDVLNLEDKLKKNENVVIKMSQSVQALFMLGPKPLSFYDLKLKHGLGYENPYMLKKAIAQNLKLYDASCLYSSKVHVNVRDTKEILEDASKSQIKMENRLKDPISIEKKQTFVFESMESDLDATWKQNNFLNDQLLEATLKHDVEKCVLMCNDYMNDDLTAEIKKVKREFKDVQECMHTRIKILEYDVQRCQKQSLDLNYSCNKRKKKENKDVTSVIRPLNRSSSSNKSVLSNTKTQSEDVEVNVGTNKKTNVASKKNVVQNKKIVTNIDVINAPKAKDVLCVSCDKNVLTSCHDKCLGHNLFSVGQFCDGDLEVAFRSKTCYVRNLEGDDLLT